MSRKRNILMSKKHTQSTIRTQRLQRNVSGSIRKYVFLFLHSMRETYRFIYFVNKLVKAREVERKKDIAEGKMDDPLVAKRLEDAITMVGTCMDMCPRFERYRRERENNLFEWETVRQNLF